MKSPFSSELVKCICLGINGYFECTRLEAQQNNYIVYFEYVENTPRKYYQDCEYDLIFIKNIKAINILGADKALSLLYELFNADKVSGILHKLGTINTASELHETYIAIALYTGWTYNVVGKF